MNDSGSYYPPGVKDNLPPSSSTVPIGPAGGDGRGRRGSRRERGPGRRGPESLMLVRTAQKSLPVVPKRGA